MKNISQLTIDKIYSRSRPDNILPTGQWITGRTTVGIGSGWRFTRYRRGGNRNRIWFTRYHEARVAKWPASYRPDITSDRVEFTEGIGS